MPRLIKYSISITDKYTGECSEYIVNGGGLIAIRDVVNKHYGCEFTSRSGVNNFITRGYEKSPNRMKQIKITKII